MSEYSDDERAENPRYSFRPSLMTAPHEFELAPDALVWSLSGRQGRIPYRDVRRVRLSFRPVNLQTYRFLTEIWSEGAPPLKFASTSWRTMMDHTRQDSAYAQFVTALHEKLAVAGSTARFEHGRPPLLYWPGLIVFVGLSLTLALIVVRSLQDGSPATFLIIAALFALLLWQVGNMFRRNRPGLYQPTAIPRQVLPGG
jgi:hypothetical protein